MAISKTKICNLALYALGEKTIADFDTPTDDNGRILSAMFDQTLDEVLVEYDWKCAKARVEIAQDSATPDFGYDYQYSVPDDCLRVISAYCGETELVDWVREGNKILTSNVDEDDELQIVYIKRLNIDELSPSMIKVLYLSLASAIAQRRARSDRKTMDLKIELENAKLQAWGIDAKEDYAEESNNDWQDAGR